MGCFTVGIEQTMLRIKEHRENFQRILGKGFEEGQLQLLGLCEVGKHKEGLKAAAIHPQHLLDGALTANEYRAEAVQAYMSVWHEAGAAQPGGVSLELAEDPTCIELSSPVLEPQLVIWDFV